MAIRIPPEPTLAFWVPGTPRSLGAEIKRPYIERIASSAKAAGAQPSTSNRLDVEIVFAAKDRSLRADVDNIAKPILDALKESHTSMIARCARCA